MVVNSPKFSAPRIIITVCWPEEEEEELKEARRRFCYADKGINLPSSQLMRSDGLQELGHWAHRKISKRRRRRFKNNFNDRKNPLLPRTFFKLFYCTILSCSMTLRPNRNGVFEDKQHVYQRMGEMDRKLLRIEWVIGWSQYSRDPLRICGLAKERGIKSIT